MGFKRALFVAGILGVVAVAFMVTMSFSAPDSEVDWEYLVVSLGKVYFNSSSPYDCNWAFDDMQTLNAIGRDGWELVTIVGQIGGDQEFVFKRAL